MTPSCDDNWEETSVKSIDVEDYMARFANLTIGKYSSDSLTVYKSRINKVVGWYTQFLDKPGWTPDVQRRNHPPKTVEKPKSNSVQTATPTQSSSQHAHPQSMPQIANDPGRVLYPYPLIDGQLIHISLPVKLSKDDARRIAAFIESIAIDSSTQEAK